MMKITLDALQKDSISSHFNVEINAVEISPEEMQNIDGGSLDRPIVTTLAVGEEDGGPIMTTMALGEEGGGPIMTTLAVGEEGGATTLAIGEECF
ncbi:hypothetical protein [Paenibacillus bouchesdurhonensis]|uniref:hypothetical protein n=1 Tax=Paenibacillus bouchesdurhonensis TaxID=1870990 RepID=UPI0018FF53F4|nr:hypothetical protein [Paenibacillus bouchesdurhonensis]